MEEIAGWPLRHGIVVLGQSVSWAELVGQLAALAVVFLARLRALVTWPVQITATVLLFLVYAGAELGGMATRQVLIMMISVYGWWAWRRGRDAVHGVAVRRGTNRQRVGTTAVFLAGVGLCGTVFAALDVSWAPWPDAWIFVGTLVAFWAQAKGFVEFWLVWLAVDAVSVPLQIMSGLWFSAVVYVVFAGLVLHGWFGWRRVERRRRAHRDSRADSVAA
ncbi:nicotinamide mononucleotide transporter family protein [Actinopolyspora mortivallis]|uniref:nicotinamide mononucleotide transporter family protein n=1 Tax=Actinopolyspora mortivallis TaxID=33906 RepID=UPI000372769E|nr:nicotinamide mononucleotide transporter family protein [Actinopolyspora mortivallis]